ncbi:MAG: ribulose-phosphate 3-epimerase [Actinobacteria bacterium RBG_19FT_COMBO_70_19]|nr:MAG: ribulose-phosphate 3-epimerase [Actinobacteria bacterium RBG_19FT_COMBO_70_19]
MGKLSVSILSADLAHLADQVKLVEPHADAIHIDIMDAHFAPPITFGPLVVASLRPVTELVLHGHLMVDVPEAQFDELAQAGMDIVSFHVEAVDDPAPVIRKARGAGMRVGMTVSPETPVEELYPNLEDLDDVMVMSVHPGWAGQRFIPEALPKLETLRAELDRRGRSIDIEIDGGVKFDNAKRCVDAGANVLVVASGIYHADDIVGAAREMKAIAEGRA